MLFHAEDRWALTYMFKHMSAWGYDWDILWEVALEQNFDEVYDAMKSLDGGVTPREAVSITSALRKAGYNHTIRSWKDV